MPSCTGTSNKTPDSSSFAWRSSTARAVSSSTSISAKSACTCGSLSRPRFLTCSWAKASAPGCRSRGRPRRTSASPSPRPSSAWSRRNGRPSTVEDGVVRDEHVLELEVVGARGAHAQGGPTSLKRMPSASRGRRKKMTGGPRRHRRSGRASRTLHDLVLGAEDLLAADPEAARDALGPRGRVHQDRVARFGRHRSVDQRSRRPRDAVRRPAPRRRGRARFRAGRSATRACSRRAPSRCRPSPNAPGRG